MGWLQRHKRKLPALIFWVLVVGGYFWYAWRNNVDLRQVAVQLVDTLRGGWGPLLYLLAYILRGMLLLPATVLTVLGGFVFGPWLGILYTVIAANASALVAYAIGRFFGDDTVQSAKTSALSSYVEGMRRNSFETILLMRLVFLPYDLVNYLAGFLRISWRAFLLATVLGSLPGTVSFVLLGASLQGTDLGRAEFKLDPWSLVISVLITLVSLGISRYFKRSKAARDA